MDWVSPMSNDGQRQNTAQWHNSRQVRIWDTGNVVCTFAKKAR